MIMTHLLLAVSLSFVAAVAPVITLERTACFGSCPVYKVKIFADGKVVYEGKKFVKRKGKIQARITKAEVQRLVSEFNNLNYLNLEDEYNPGGPNCPEGWTDHPSAITSLEWQGKKKTIRHYHGCKGAPVLDQLTALEDKIDEIAKTKRWLR